MLGGAPAAGQRRGAGRLPLGCKVPGRLPPGVAAGQDPEQQEYNAGGPEEQSGPHDRQRRVPPGSLVSGEARGGGGCRPSPLLLAPRGANQRAPSWHAEPSRGTADAERRGRGPRGAAAQGWGSPVPQRKTQKVALPARGWPWSPGQGQRSGTPGGGVSPSAHTPCLCLGVGSQRSPAGVRLRPKEERDFGNKAGAEGASPERYWSRWSPRCRCHQKMGSVEIHAQDSGCFHCWAVLGRRPACQQVCTLPLNVPVSGSTCSLGRNY